MLTNELLLPECEEGVTIAHVLASETWNLQNGV